MEKAQIDSNQREYMKHGTQGFPFAVYEDRYCNSAYPVHWHDELEIGYAAKGNVTVEINRHTYVLEEGNGIFINTGTLHGPSGWGDTEVIFPNVLFQASLVYGSIESTLYEKYLSRLLTGMENSFLLLDRRVEWQGRLLSYLKESIAVAQEGAWGYEFRVRELLARMLLLVLENSAAVSVPRTEDKKSIVRLRCMVDYIKAHYAQELRLDDIAAAASVGKRECLRCFHTFMGKSPKQYVTELRIYNARRLLEDTMLSIREVGELCGFLDASYFSKVFREYCGLSPREYKKRREANAVRWEITQGLSE